METAIEVTAAAQLIQSTPAVQTLMGPTQVQELPLNNRNFVQLATLVPGVSSSLADEVGIGLTSTVSSRSRARGATPSTGSWTGRRTWTWARTSPCSRPRPSSRSRSSRSSPSSYNAEWPRSGGGIVNVVTKCGSNTFRASAYEFFRNDVAERQQLLPQAEHRPRRSATTRRKLDYNNFGYTAGRPGHEGQAVLLLARRSGARSPAPRPPSVATVPDPAWLNDPTNANYVAPGLRDPNAVRLLEAWPAPNLGTNQFQNTRAERPGHPAGGAPRRLEHRPKWRLMARYTHDLSETTEAGGLFFNTAIPNIATTLTRVPGQVFVGQLTTTISRRMLNEFSFQFSGNAIKSVYGDNVRNTRDAFGLTIPELFPENREGLIPHGRGHRAFEIGANQLFDNKYRNYTVADNLSYQTGNHSLKGGFLVAFEQKDELSDERHPGRLQLRRGRRPHRLPELPARQRRRALRRRLHLHRARVRDRLPVPLQPLRVLPPGLLEGPAGPHPRSRPALRSLPGGHGRERPPDQLRALALRPAAAPTFERRRHHPRGGHRRPHERDRRRGPELALRAGDLRHRWTSIQPRLGFSWDLKNDGRTVVRGGYGIYYDQPLIGIFLQNAFVNPPLVTNPVVLNPQLSNPGAGQSRTAGRRSPSSPPATPSRRPAPCSGTSASSASSTAGASSTSATSARAATT